jgi:type IV secretory pathway TrbL component
MNFINTFIGKALSEKGEPSSKRLAGFVIIVFALTMELFTLFIRCFQADFTGIGFDVFGSLLVAGLTSLGISQIGKNDRTK